MSATLGHASEHSEFFSGRDPAQTIRKQQLKILIHSWRTTAMLHEETCLKNTDQVSPGELMVQTLQDSPGEMTVHAPQSFYTTNQYFDDVSINAIESFAGIPDLPVSRVEIAVDANSFHCSVPSLSMFFVNSTDYPSGEFPGARDVGSSAALREPCKKSAGGRDEVRSGVGAGAQRG